MRVHAEAFILYSFLMNWLCLTPAWLSCGARTRITRVALTAFAFALLSVVQYLLPYAFRSPPVVLLTPLLMSPCAFGRKKWLSSSVITLITGFCLSGLTAYLSARLINPFVCVACCAPAAVVTAAALAKKKFGPVHLTAEITAFGRVNRIPAIVDTGNRLTDGKAPVIVVPEQMLGMPDEAALLIAPPRGFCLLPAKTVTGRALLPAFYADQIILEADGKTQIVRGTRVAVSPQGAYALIPPCLMERGADFVRHKTVGMAAPSFADGKGTRRGLYRRKRSAASAADLRGRTETDTASQNRRRASTLHPD